MYDFDVAHSFRVDVVLVINIIVLSTTVIHMLRSIIPNMEVLDERLTYVDILKSCQQESAICVIGSPEEISSDLMFLASRKLYKSETHTITQYNWKITISATR